MTVQILKGAEVADALNKDLALRSESLREKGIIPKLAIVRVGERGDDISYEKGAAKRAEKVYVEVETFVLPADAAQAKLIGLIEEINANDAIHGVLLFRPLPAHINEDLVRNTLDPKKDIDGITDLSLAAIFASTPTGFAPCTAEASMEVLAHYGYRPEGKRAVVVGRSLVIGKPVAMMLLKENATVTIAHSRTKDLMQVVRDADIVIACVGRAEMLNDDYVSEGQIIIDVGINVTRTGNLVGDVDFEDVEEVVGAITPVPGGVGTVTTSVLMKHVIEAAEKASAK